jgi:hypothetical protein
VFCRSELSKGYSFHAFDYEIHITKRSSILEYLLRFIMFNYNYELLLRAEVFELEFCGTFYAFRSNFFSINTWGIVKETNSLRNSISIYLLTTKNENNI